MIVTVVFQRVTDLDKIRRCHRCEGTGRERHVPGQCPRCNGTGARPEGWDYALPKGLTVELGSVVVCPPTPRSHGVEVMATVIGFYVWPARQRLLKTIIRLGSWQEINS